jgi:hypothetical protein
MSRLTARAGGSYGDRFADAPEPIDGFPPFPEIIYDIATIVAAILGVGAAMTAVVLAGGLG